MRKLFLLVVAMLMAITVQALPLRDGHFFKTFRDGRVQSAKDLYGDNSAEVEAVAKAWDLVGVTDDTPTGIVEAKTDSSCFPHPSSLSSWYTIDGRQLSSKPTTKGLYIYHGRVVVVK